MSDKFNEYIDGIELKDNNILKNMPQEKAGGIDATWDSFVSDSFNQNIWQKQMPSNNVNTFSNTGVLQPGINTGDVFKKFDVGLEINPMDYINTEELIEVENRSKALPTKVGFWSKFKAILNTKIEWNSIVEIELTPYQQKVEDDINRFLATPIQSEKIWKGIHDFLFKDISFGFKKG